MSNTETPIAVVVPTYNSADYIGDALDSIERQTLTRNRSVYVYVVDDCSTDDTLSIVQSRTCSRFPIQVVTSAVNLGSQRNVNRGLRVSSENSAEWVFILHADDIAKPLWLETMLSRIDECDSRLATICSSWDLLFPDGRVVTGEDNLTKPVERIEGGSASIRGTLLKGCWWHVSGCVIRTEALADFGLFDPQLESKGDWDWILRCLRKKWVAEYIPRTLIFYRQHRKSVSTISFASSRDILETLVLARRTCDVMTTIDILRFHIRLELFLLRRIIRGATERRPRKMVHLLRVMAKSASNAILCISKVPAVSVPTRSLTLEASEPESR